MFPPPGKRISVNGTSGSGKSTLAHRLSRITGHRHIELDSIYHLENWQPMPRDEFLQIVDAATSADAWITDGNYSMAKAVVWERCDTVVWLDFPLPIILSRLIRRIMRRTLRRELLWGRNRESLFTHLFTKESLIYWVLTTYKRRRREADQLFSSPSASGKTMIRFKHPREADAWLEELSACRSRDRAD